MAKVYLRLQLEDKIEYIAIKKKTDTSEIVLREYDVSGYEYEVMVVDPSSEFASPARIQLASGVKALRKLPWTYIGSPDSVYALISYNGKLYAGSSSGIYYLSDEGDWVKISEIVVSHTGYRTFKYLPMQVYSGALYVGGGDKKVYRYNGTTWSEVGGLPYTITSFVVFGGSLYICAGGVYRYQGGSSWQNIYYREDCDYCFLNGLDFITHNSQLYVVRSRTSTVLYLREAENSWKIVSNSLPFSGSYYGGGISYAGNIYVGDGLRGTVARWNGQHYPNDIWTTVSDSLPMIAVYMIEYNGKIYVGDYGSVSCYEGDSEWSYDPLSYSILVTGDAEPSLAIHNGKLYASGVWRYDINQ